MNAEVKDGVGCGVGGGLGGGMGVAGGVRPRVECGVATVTTFRSAELQVYRLLTHQTNLVLFLCKEK